MDWSRGRVLSAFQLIVLSAGEGWFESKENPAQKITRGQCFLLFPGVWHRYKPNPKTGWTEHWFELGGKTLEQYLTTLGFNAANPVLKPLNSALILSLFQNFHRLGTAQSRGYRPVISSMALTILTEISAQVRSKESSLLNDDLVRRAFNLLSNINGSQQQIHKIAKQLNVSYPTLHRHFSEEIGLSPKQYLEQIRIAKAIQLLSTSKLSIKEIASRLGYYSAFHFSHDFKKHHHLAPAHWRAQHLKKYYRPSLSELNKL